MAAATPTTSIEAASDSTVDATAAPTTDATALAGEGDVSDKDAKDLAAGWFKDSAAWPHIILWGLLLAAIALGARVLGTRLRKRWLISLAAAAPFLVVLYFFFQNINRLLPPGL